jgi:hypothetical protein
MLAIDAQRPWEALFDGNVYHTPQCYANITVDKNHVFNTKVVVGSSPEWDECFNV